MQKPECEFKFAKLESQTRLRFHMQIWKVKIYLTVHDENHEINFCDRVPNEKN